MNRRWQSRARLARKSVARAQRGAGARRGVDALLVGQVLLTTWKAVLALHDAEELFDAPLQLDLGTRGAAVMLQGGMALRRAFEARKYGAPLGAPQAHGRALSPLEAIPLDVMADNVPLRLFAAQLSRAHLGVLVALPHLRAFLGADWCIVGGPELLRRWSFHREIQEVVIFPSFLLSALSRRRLRSLHCYWPNARLSWRAPLNSPSALALQMICA
jgi:hypothetical protein